METIIYTVGAKSIATAVIGRFRKFCHTSLTVLRDVNFFKDMTCLHRKIANKDDLIKSSLCCICSKVVFFRSISFLDPKNAAEALLLTKSKLYLKKPVYRNGWPLLKTTKRHYFKESWPPHAPMLCIIIYRVFLSKIFCKIRENAVLPSMSVKVSVTSFEFVEFQLLK